MQNSQHSTQNSQTQHEDTQVDDNSKQYYDIEKLLRRRKFNGEHQFLVKWVGFKEKTWEPEHYIPTNLVRHFLATKTQKGTRRKRVNRHSCFQEATP